MRDINQGIAEFFRNLRRERGLSKLKMANLLYMDDKTWDRYEQGKTSPSIGEFIWICEKLNVDALRPVLDILYPDTYKHITPQTDIDQLREAAAHYFMHVASDRTVREWDYITFGQHGSDMTAQMQEFCVIAHLPLEYRVLIARLVKSCWDIAEAKGELINPNNVMPDLDLFSSGIEKGHQAASEGLKSYFNKGTKEW